MKKPPRELHDCPCGCQERVQFLCRWAWRYTIPPGLKTLWRRNKSWWAPDQRDAHKLRMRRLVLQGMVNSAMVFGPSLRELQKREHGVIEDDLEVLPAGAIFVPETESPDQAAR